jgi:hypothetical protein
MTSKTSISINAQSQELSIANTMTVTWLWVTPINNQKISIIAKHQTIVKK